MPTQHDFRAAAGDLRSLATTAGSSAVAVNDVNGSVGLTGGTAQGIVDAAMNAAFLNARAVESSSNNVAAELDRRADVCAHYTNEMRRWRAQMNSWHNRWQSYMSELSVNPDAIGPGYQPSQPIRPAPWVEEG